MLVLAVSLRDIVNVVVASLVVGVGVTAVFAVMLLATVRAGEARRAGRGALAWSVLAVAGGVAILAAVALGLREVAA